MANIMQWKQLLVVELKDWTVLHTNKSLQELATLMNDSDSNYMLIDWVLFNKFEFKKAQEKKPDDITLYKLSLSESDKELVKRRETKMKELWKYRESTAQIEKWLKRAKANK